MHIIMHPAQDHIGDRLGGIAALVPVAVHFLDPFQIDHRHHADFQIGVFRQVHHVVFHRPVQALVKQHVGAFLEIGPIGESARGRAQRLALRIIMHIVAGFAAPGLAIFAKHPLQLAQLVGFKGKMAERVVARPGALFKLGLHRRAVIAVKGITLDAHRLDPLAAENLVKGVFHRRGACPRGAGNRDNRVFGAHLLDP